MKKHSNKSKIPAKAKVKVIQELATALEQDLKKTLPISIQPDGSVVYKDYYIKEVANGNWGLYNRANKSLIEEFYLKTSALMGAKYYNEVKLEKYFSIKHLDNRYWASYTDSLIYSKNMKITKDFDRYQILLNRFEHSSSLSSHYKEEISKMFRWSFV